MKEIQRVEPKEIIIVDGILILVEKLLRDLMDIKLFVDTDADERLIRRIRRDMIDSIHGSASRHPNRGIAA